MLAILGRVLEQPCGGRGSLARPSGPPPAHGQSRGSGEDSGRHVKQSAVTTATVSLHWNGPRAWGLVGDPAPQGTAGEPESGGGQPRGYECSAGPGGGR